VLSNYWDNFLAWLTPLSKEPPGLAEEVNTARRDWQQALYDFDFITDKNLIDYSAHKIKAYERQYIAILELARQEKISAWQLEPPGDASNSTAPPATEEASQQP